MLSTTNYIFFENHLSFTSLCITSSLEIRINFQIHFSHPPRLYKSLPVYLFLFLSAHLFTLTTLTIHYAFIHSLQTKNVPLPQVLPSSHHKMLVPPPGLYDYSTAYGTFVLISYFLVYLLIVNLSAWFLAVDVDYADTRHFLTASEQYHNHRLLNLYCRK